MRYIFKILIFSGNPEISNLYISEAFNEIGEEKESYNEWYREIKVLEDYCDLEVDVITNITADFDELLPTADGIIYFLNPLEIGEFELFKMLLPEIFSVKRDIPTVIIFYDQNGILPMSVNELLETIWVNYLSLEAFVNLKPKNFHQALQALCLAMINGDSPLNIENAWMRFPIFIQMANIYYDNKNYYYAAQAVKKAALIADIYNKEDYFILSEQAAYLYSKLNLYLEASKILEKVDRRKSINYKKLYAEAMITDGNRLFNKGKYEEAAKIYEKAAQWSSIELQDDKIIHEAFRLSINSWISACRVENAFRILESLSHKEMLTILKEISKKIRDEGDFLVNVNDFESAREQLYRAIDKYQREGLSEEIEKLTEKLSDILIRLLKQQVNQNEIYAAKQTYDEIENLYESYNVEKKNLDSILEKLITLFLKEYNFGISTILISKLSSLKLKKNLTKLSSIAEDEYKVSKKKEIEENLKKGVDLLGEFIEAELNIIVDMNSQKIKEANKLIELNEHLNAANILKNQANYLKMIGKEDIGDQILTKSLDILLRAKIFEDFFVLYEHLTEDMKKKYLTGVYPLYILKLKEIKKQETYKRNESIFENSNRIFRNQMLYDESKQISLLFIKIIKKEALNVVEREENLSGINQAIELDKKIRNIASAYLEKEERLKINLDDVYKKIAEIYIVLDDLHQANIYNDKIEDKIYKAEIHKRIANLEAEKSGFESKKAEEKKKAEILKERLSIIKSKAQGALMDREKEFRERKGLKRVYFEEALNFIKNQEIDKALEIYRNNIVTFNKRKKYNLAGVSLVLASLILMKQNKTQEITKLLNETKKELSNLWKLISESFPIKLIEYIIELEKLKDEPKLKEAISYIENLPLFEEELEYLYDYLGKDYKKEVIREKSIEQVEEKFKIEIDQRFAKIKSKTVDIRREKSDFYIKRKAMRKRYYLDVLSLLEIKEFKKAGKTYFDLAITISKRQDYNTSSLLILLHGLSLLKAGESIQLIRDNVNNFLNSLGINRKLVEDTFYILLILFLLDVKLYKMERFLPKINEMLEILPLFEEEKELISLKTES
ncbi:MAG: hypothetical protein ACFFAQ_02030 [Promethearchaeota archaeon]